MRRAISFILALGLSIGGAAVLVSQVFFAPLWHGAIVMAASFTLALGIAWLWSDFRRSPRAN